jgi:hypothetical protein
MASSSIRLQQVASRGFASLYESLKLESSNPALLSRSRRGHSDKTIHLVFNSITLALPDFKCLIVHFAS